MKIRILVVFLLLLISLYIFGENVGLFSISVTPGMELPFETDPKYFTSGGGVGIDGEYRLPFFPFLGLYSLQLTIPHVVLSVKSLHSEHQPYSKSLLTFAL